MQGLKSTLETTFKVRPDGIVDRVAVKHAPNGDIEKTLKDEVESWVLIPPGAKGILSTDEHQLTIELLCMAFPTSEEGTCTPRIRP